MLLPFNRVMRNPTLKTEIEDKGLGDTYSFGFPMYAVGQCADILAFRPELVPVGEDQVAHIEPCREVARRFNQLYCGVDPQTEDEDYVAARAACSRSPRPRSAASAASRASTARRCQEPQQRDLPLRHRQADQEEDRQDHHGPADHGRARRHRPTSCSTMSARSSPTPTSSPSSNGTLRRGRQHRRRARQGRGPSAIETISPRCASAAPSVRHARPARTRSSTSSARAPARANETRGGDALPRRSKAMGLDFGKRTIAFTD
jgi:tryptophanyl-tRNA synthetase